MKKKFDDKIGLRFLYWKSKELHKTTTIFNGNYCTTVTNLRSLLEEINHLS